LGLLIDLLLEGKEVVVVGGGSVGERKTLQLLDAGAAVTVVSRRFTDRLLNMGREGKVRLIRSDIRDGSILRELKLKPKVVVISLNDKSLNRSMVEEARAIGALVLVVDNPSISDFTMPAVAKVGDVRVGVSTGGRSPAMAAVIRRRVEGMISERDLRHIDLQSYVRGLAKMYIPSHEGRRRILRMIMEDSVVNDLLDKGRVSEAKMVAERVVMKAAGGGVVKSRASRG